MKNILFFLKVPPPVTGATMMNNRILHSQYLNKFYLIRSIKISYSNSVKELGNKSIRKIIKSILYGIKLFYELIFHKPNFVYFQISLFGFSFVRDSIFVWIIKIFKVPILFHFRVKGLNNYVEKKRIRQAYYRKVFRNTNVICLSELLINDISNIYFENPFIVYNGIPIVKGYIRKKDTNRIVKINYLSNLIKSKGVLDLINALEILHKGKIKFKCIIVGAVAELTIEYINEILRAKSLSKMVECIGPKYANEKYEVLKNSDIFVFPTFYRYEAFPGVLLDAMQFGLPVISTYEASIPIIVDDGETGYLVPKNRPDLIAEKIEYLINNPNIRIKMGEKGRDKFLKNFTFDIFEKNMKKVFDKVVKLHSQ